MSEDIDVEERGLPDVPDNMCLIAVVLIICATVAVCVGMGFYH